jgi:hypothetical protein
MEAYTHDFVAQFPHLIQEVLLVLTPARFSGNKPIQHGLHVSGAEMPIFVPLRMALLEFQNAPSGEEELRTCR